MDKYSELIRTLLGQRNIHNAEDAEVFINPDYDLHTHDPFLMHGMEQAVKRILHAIEQKEKIAIYSDFDADGIPGGVLLHDLFKKIGYTNFTNYIPHRNEEGYGFHKGAVDKLAKGGASLIITVDVGITDVDTVQHASELGVDCIITDHHEPHEQAPNAIAVLNPKQGVCQYPFKELSGTGVAYKLAQALLSRMSEEAPEGWEKWLLDLVAIATVADMVPLVGENRVLTWWGLVVLRKSRRPGIVALCKKLGTKQHLLTEDDIGFMIAPRINAASRMDDPEDAFTLLATESEQEALDTVSHLERLNNKRKAAVAAIVRELTKRFTNAEHFADANVLVAGNPKWSPALLGLAAGSIAERFGKPVCLWGREGTGNLKGSCRSGGTVHVIDMLRATGDTLLDCGGHEGAGGFSVSHEQVHTLPEALNNAFEQVTAGGHVKDTTSASNELTLALATQGTYRELNLLAPFGVGNAKPVFVFKNLKVESVRAFGKEQNHLEVFVSADPAMNVRAFDFFTTVESFAVPITEGTNITLHATIEESRWNGRKIELRIIDIVQ